MNPPARALPRPSLAPSSQKARQLSHLHSQLAQLQAHLADLEEVSRVTAVQAEHIRVLGSLNGALLMGAAKVLGEQGAGEAWKKEE
ncbi:hypothetical protein EDC01DRAFT_641319 [Geopyxis carbonaria]|nr:hypothetical protein EDC01DRAFT_641319 [Geopyxis carbonaria]